MPVVLSYPGVYIEEIPSGQFTITGVATSITAFVGRARLGPIDEPITLFSFGDYERMFGGLAYDYPLSYAVQDFFLNGGGQAIVARLFESSGGPSETAWETAVPATLKSINTALTALAMPADAAAFDAACASAANAITDTPGSLIAQEISKQLQADLGATTPIDAAAIAKLIAGVKAPVYPTGVATIAVNRNGGDAVAKPAQDVARAAVAALLALPIPPDPSAPTADADAAGLLAVTTAATNAALQSPDVQAARIARVVAHATDGKDALAAAKASMNNVASAIPAGAPAGSDILTAVQTVLAAQLEQIYPDRAASAGDSAVVAAGTKIATALKALTGSAQAAGEQVADAVTQASTDKAATVASVFDAALAATVAASFTVPDAEVLTLQAANPGGWGNQLTVSLDRHNITAHSAQRYQAEHLTENDLFNIDVIYTRDDGSVDTERFTNVTVNRVQVGNKPVANRLDLVLAANSRYVRVPLDTDGKTPVMPSTPPVAGQATPTGTASGGDDGAPLSQTTYLGDEDQKTGLYMLKKTDLFNLLCIPPDQRTPATDTDPSVYQEALALCVARRAMLIVDPPCAWAGHYAQGELARIQPTDLYLTGEQARNAAVYFPRVVKEDVLMDGQLDVFPACGAIAGVIASTDVQRGVWKAPAGQNAGLANIRGLEISLNDPEQGMLNVLGINCLRNLSVIGPVIWGARTLRGADVLSDDFKYLSVRRLALFIEESLYRGTRWAVFEPNNEALWSSLRLSINAFMGDLAKQGAFYGFKIKCDADTNPQTNIDLGIVTVLVQYAPVKPAEFVVLQFQQQAGVSPV